jgi:23S rRNA (adenine2030-N6)-methyltransferase
MNYRHAYHAGNHGDVLKHVVLARVIDYLKHKDKLFHVIDAHAGVGAYALEGPEAAKTKEWEGGVAKMQAAFGADVEALLMPYRQVIADLNADHMLRFYPGSPEIAVHLLRKGDFMTFNELHPDDFETLRARYEPDPRVRITQMDAAQLLKANLPPRVRRGIVLIDPPYEQKAEKEAMVKALADGHKRFANGIFLVWYPVKGKDYAEQLCADFQKLALSAMLKVEVRVREAFDGGGLAGSGVIIVNPPWPLEDELKLLVPVLADRLGVGTWGRGTIEWLVPPIS